MNNLTTKDTLRQTKGKINQQVLKRSKKLERNLVNSKRLSRRRKTSIKMSMTTSAQTKTKQQPSSGSPCHFHRISQPSLSLPNWERTISSPPWLTSMGRKKTSLMCTGKCLINVFSQSRTVHIRKSTRILSWWKSDSRNKVSISAMLCFETSRSQTDWMHSLRKKPSRSAKVLISQCCHLRESKQTSFHLPTGHKQVNTIRQTSSSSFQSHWSRASRTSSKSIRLQSKGVSSHIRETLDVSSWLYSSRTTLASNSRWRLCKLQS